MRKILLAAVLAAVTALPATASITQPYVTVNGPVETGCQWINGYYRQDGTFVQGHWRGCP